MPKLRTDYEFRTTTRGGVVWTNHGFRSEAQAKTAAVVVLTALALRGVRYRVTPGPGPYGALLAAKFEQIISTKTPVSNERPRLRTQQTTIDQMGLALLMGPGLQQLKWKLYSDEWNPMVPVSQAGWYYPQVDPWEPDAVRWNGWRYVARCITSVRGDAWLGLPLQRRRWRLHRLGRGLRARHER